jgi:hypothetical protein
MLTPCEPIELRGVAERWATSTLEHRHLSRRPSLGRIERLPDGRVRLAMKRVWSDGTSAIEFSPFELTERLASLVPAFRANQLRYAGLLAGNAVWRGGRAQGAQLERRGARSAGVAAAREAPREARPRQTAGRRPAGLG